MAFFAVSNILDSVLSGLNTGIRTFASAAQGAARTIGPQVSRVVARSVARGVTVAKTQLQKNKNQNQLEQQAIGFATRQGLGAIGALSGVLIWIVGLTLSLLIFCAIPLIRKSLIKLFSRLDDFLDSFRKTRGRSRKETNIIYIVFIIIVSVPISLIRNVILPVLRNLPIIIFVLVLTIVWIYVIEFNGPFVVETTEHVAQGLIMGSNIAIRLFDKTIQVGNFLLPLRNLAAQVSAETVITVYDAIKARPRFSINVPEITTDPDLFRGRLLYNDTFYERGRRNLEFLPNKPQDVSPVIKRSFRTMIKLELMRLKITKVVLKIVLGSGIAALFFLLSQLVTAGTIKTICVAASPVCAIREILEYIANILVTGVNLLFAPIFSFFNFKIPDVTGVACRADDFTPDVPTDCAGGVDTVVAPGLFKNLPVTGSRRLSCEYYDGTYTEYMGIKLLHETTNSSEYCPHTYRAFKHPLENVLVMEDINMHDCYEICHLGTLFESCPEHDNHLKIKGQCLQETPLPPKQRDLSGVTPTSRFQIIRSLKQKIPLEFTVAGMECNLKSANPDVYEQFFNMLCMAMYLSQGTDFSSLVSKTTTPRRMMNDISLDYFRHKSRQLKYMMETDSTNQSLVDYMLFGTDEDDYIQKPSTRPSRELLSVYKKCPDDIPILCYADFKTCVSDEAKCPEVPEDGTWYQYAMYQYEGFFQLTEQFDFNDFAKEVYDCWKEYTPATSPMSDINLQLPVEEQVKLTYCFPMVAPVIWEPTYFNLSVSSAIDQYVCSSSNSFAGCTCPGYYSNVQIMNFYSNGFFDWRFIYVILNGLLAVWFVCSLIFPLVYVLSILLPLPTLTLWNMIKGDLTLEQEIYCFVRHLGSLGLFLWFVLVIILFTNFIFGVYQAIEYWLWPEYKTPLKWSRRKELYEEEAGIQKKRDYSLVPSEKIA